MIWQLMCRKRNWFAIFCCWWKVIAEEWNLYSQVTVLMFGRVGCWKVLWMSVGWLTVEIHWGNRAYKPNSRLAQVLDILFILHAEHEMNCSTAAARHLASSGVDVYTALSGAVGALYGPLHGGANEAVLKMLSEIGSVENIPEFIEGVKSRKRKMSGFGHRVYKNYDPRAKVIRKLADEVFSIVGRDPLIEVAVALEKVALSDEFFVKRKLYPNVDFYSGLIYIGQWDFQRSSSQFYLQSLEWLVTWHTGENPWMPKQVSCSTSHGSVNEEADRIV